MGALTSAIQSASGQPSSVRIGVVSSVSPLTVSIQGTVLTNVGVMAPLQMRVGMSVALLGQSNSAGSDPASWLVIGASQPVDAVATTVMDGVQNTLQSTTSVAYILGTVTVGVAFIAPPSGSVLVHTFASIDNSAAGSGFLSPEIRLGSTVGAGTVMFAASDQNAMRNANTEFVKFGITQMFSGLTAGTTYNVSLWHRSSVGTNTAFFNDRNVIVQPL